MKIALDARSLLMPRPRGTGRNLYDAYRLIPSLRPDWAFTLYHQRPIDEALFETDDLPDAPRKHANLSTRWIEMPGDRFDWWFQYRLPYAARRDRIDLLHLPANAAPARCPVPFVVTIHDLIPLRVAGEASRRMQRRFRAGVERAVRRAQHIITPSAATRDDLCAEFRVPEASVTVVPWAPDRLICDTLAGATLSERTQKIAAVRARYRLPPRWLLNFSGNSRRKNAEGVVRGFARLPCELRTDLGLLLVGCEPAGFRSELEQLAQRSGVGAQCRFAGFTPHDDLPWLLAGSSGLLMPSLCEGFGLPLLDAFAAGAAVLTSDRSSMPQVAAAAAVYCDPANPQSIAAGIVELLDPKRAVQLTRRGRARLKSYSWERTAEAMCAVYEQSCCAIRPRRSRSARDRSRRVEPLEVT